MAHRSVPVTVAVRAPMHARVVVGTVGWAGREKAIRQTRRADNRLLMAGQVQRIASAGAHSGAKPGAGMRSNARGVVHRPLGGCGCLLARLIRGRFDESCYLFEHVLDATHLAQNREGSPSAAFGASAGRAPRDRRGRTNSRLCFLRPKCPQSVINVRSSRVSSPTAARSFALLQVRHIANVARRDCSPFRRRAVPAAHVGSFPTRSQTRAHLLQCDHGGMQRTDSLQRCALAHCKRLGFNISLCSPFTAPPCCHGSSWHAASSSRGFPRGSSRHPRPSGTECVLDATRSSCPISTVLGMHP